MNTNEQFNLNKCPICKNALKYHTETPIEVPPEAPLYNPINIFRNGGLVHLVRDNGLEDDDDLSNKYDTGYSYVIKYTFIQMVLQFPLMLMWANKM